MENPLQRPKLLELNSSQIVIYWTYFKEIRGEMISPAGINMDFNQDKGERHPWQSFNRAPHKPLLMLAICRGFSAGRITDCYVRPTPELVADFQHLSTMVDGKKREFRLPFFHISRDGWWWLMRHDGNNSTNDKIPKSMKGIREAYSAAVLTDNLLPWLTDLNRREELIQTILTKYFDPSVHSSLR
jgi:predicted restriction endonuclease